MLEPISLDKLALGREGVRVGSMQLTRVTSSKMTEEVLPSALHALFTANLYLLPAEISEGETYAVVTLTQDDEKDRWSIHWERVPSTPVPDHIAEQRAEDPDAAWLALGEAWSAHAPDSSTSISTSYLLDGWESDLTHFHQKEFGHLIAHETGAVWRIEGASMLTGISLLAPSKKEPAKMPVIAMGRAEPGGWPDVSGLEAILWKDTLTLLRRTQR